jgi:xanthine dehydrogenase/oxidase
MTTRELPQALKDRLLGFNNELRFWLNGQEIKIANLDPTTLLVDFLHERGLTGTKVGCAQGGCGACTVMVSRRTRDGIDHRAINSCLRLLASVADSEVTTIEGIGNIHDGLDPVQYSIAVNNGTQCGFCTPGFVMNMHAYLQKHESPTQQQIEDIFGGNLCRCTGYRPILHGMRTFACDYEKEKDCTQPCQIDPFFPIKVREQIMEIGSPDLPDAASLERLYFFAEGVHWVRPTTFKEVQELKTLFASYAGADAVKLVVGNTAYGIYPNEHPRFFIDVSRIREMSELFVRSDMVHVGAAVAIQDLVELSEELIGKYADHLSVGLKELVRHAKHIAGIQVRNAGSVAGNVFITKSHTRKGLPFPSDLFTVLAALGTYVTVWSAMYKGTRRFILAELPIAEELPTDALYVSFDIPLSKKDEYIQTYRIARRPQMAHAVVNAGFKVKLNAQHTVEDMTIVYGGLATCNGRLPETEKWLVGKKWDQSTLRNALDQLRKEVKEILVPMEEEGFTEEYRSQLAETFFYKFFLHVAKNSQSAAIEAPALSAAEHDVRPLSSGQQHFEIEAEMDPLTNPIAKRTAFSQATGDIRYVTDEPLPPGGYHGVLVMSTRPHARFEFKAGLKATEEVLRREFPGFVTLVTAADIPEGGTNKIGLGGDDPVFSDKVVTSIGAPIALVLAEKRLTAKKAAEYVSSECIRYEDLPAVVSFDKAIAEKHVMPKGAGLAPDPAHKHFEVTREGSNEKWLVDPTKALPGSTVVSGTMRTHAQSHFYMETMCALAMPGNYDNMTILSSTQNPNGDQAQIARVLGVKANRITIRLEQLGGGFGGKQNRAVFIGAQTAVAASKVRRPVRVLFDRETDMQTVGKRHPHTSDYHVSYTDDGTINGISLELRSDGGDTIDCSLAVIKGGVMMSDGCYMVPTFHSSGTVFKTNKTSNTAMRTFGQVQPHLTLEDAIEHMAFDLSKRTGKTVRPEEIRRKHLYKTCEYENAETTHFGQPLWYCDLREQWDQFYKQSDFEKRLDGVLEFNSKNRWKKRGISMIPLKYGIGFKQLPAMNTSTALVSVNKEDGSVMVCHGGVEMGQGIHTRIAQVASAELNIPLEYIRVNANSTNIIVNAPATAASTGFDLNGGAVAMACRELKRRLEGVCDEVKRRMPDDQNLKEHWRDNWKKIVAHAYTQKVCLHATELYAAPHYDQPVDHYDKGKFFAYFTYSFSISEVEIDVLTGEFTVLRTDLLYDAGKSLNPALDIGQIEGGFVQGLGFVTTEEALFNEEGRLVSDNIWSYKPPCTKTIPIDLRVTLVPRDSASCAKQEQHGLLAVKASKSTSEPCLSLGNSVYFAIKHAIRAARREQTGKDEWVELAVPLSCQRIQQACQVNPDQFTLAGTTEQKLAKD